MTHYASLFGPDPGLFLTDGGMETWLIFERGFELREFASFELIFEEDGKAALTDYFLQFLTTAETEKTGFVLDTPTWRASPDWCEKLGYARSDVHRVNTAAVDFIRRLKTASRNTKPVLLNGVVGPRGDGYVAGDQMSVAEAQSYHAAQIGAFVDAGIDLVSAVTMTYVEEALGIAQAAKAAGAPVVISFTVETDGRLPSGQALGEAIAQVDAATDGAPLYFMINCAHPDHFKDALATGAKWLDRIGGIRANASRMSHEELDNAEELDAGNPQELAQDYKSLMAVLPNLVVVGGCCGTDHRHVHAIGTTCRHAHAA